MSEGQKRSHECQLTFHSIKARVSFFSPFSFQDEQINLRCREKCSRQGHPSAIVSNPMRSLTCSENNVTLSAFSSSLRTTNDDRTFSRRELLAWNGRNGDHQQSD